jgi:competence/damage-inducible protein CinA-like protein
MSSRRGRAALVAVGDELISGEQLDLNTSWLAERLGELGWTVDVATLVGDDQEEIARTFRQLSQRAELVLSTGGLGPTLDDVTRHAAADAAGVELVLDEEAAAAIRAWFVSAGREASATNDRQALFPAGAEIVPNSAGTAPGFRVQLEGCTLIVLPGPPREMNQVFEEQVRPWLVGLPQPGDVSSSARFFLIGLPESDFAHEVGDWMQRDANPRIGVCAGGGVLKVKLEGRATSGEQAASLVAGRADEFRQRFARWIFSETNASPAVGLAELLIEEGVSFACAESCTGGGLAAALTDVAGISTVFREGVVTYSNEAKIARLGVEPELLAAHGAVSEEVAGAMSRGVAERAGVRLALSTTGIAGPGGGSAEKPVGLVCFGVTLDGQTTTHTRRFPDRGRAFVRQWAIFAACELARRALTPSSKGD